MIALIPVIIGCYALYKKMPFLGSFLIMCSIYSLFI